MKHLLILILLFSSLHVFSQIQYDTLTREELMIEKTNLEKIISDKSKFKPVIVIAQSTVDVRRTASLLSSNVIKETLPGDSIQILNYEDDFFQIKMKGIQKGYIPTFHFAFKDGIFEQMPEINRISLVTQNLERVKNAIKKSYEKELVELQAEKDEIEKGLHLNTIVNKAKTLSSPIALEEASISFNSIGVPEANFSGYNISNNIIDAYTVEVFCYDNFNNPVRHYLHNSNIFKGISQNEVSPNGAIESMWELHGYDNTTKIKIALTKVHFTNGKTWIPTKGKPVIKSF